MIGHFVAFQAGENVEFKCMNGPLDHVAWGCWWLEIRPTKLGGVLQILSIFVVQLGVSHRQGSQAQLRPNHQARNISSFGGSPTSTGEQPAL
jgi:hypothetical protein